VHDGHRTLVICVARHREAHAPGESKVSGRLLVEEDRLDTLRFERDLEALDVAERVLDLSDANAAAPANFIPAEE